MTQDIRTIRIATQGPAGPAGICGIYDAASQTEMLALAADRGDIAIRSDLSKCFILAAADPSVLANWRELLTPPAPVSSVAGRTGAVALSAGDVSGLAASATADTTNAANISAGTLSNARLSGVALAANNLSDLASAAAARGNLGLSQNKVIAYSNVESTVHTGDTGVATFASILVPGNAIGANGTLMVTVLFNFTGTAGTKTGIVTFGGTTFYAVASGATSLSQRVQVEICNRNATNAQVGASSTAAQGGWGNSTANVVTAVIDTTVDQSLVIQGQLGNAGDSIAVESYRVEAINP